MSGMIYPNTADQRRLPNSNAKTLLENWVEERAVKQIESATCTKAQNLKNTHKGLITINENAPFSKVTTYNNDYFPRKVELSDESKGARYKLIEEMVRRQVMEELDQQNALNDDNCDHPISYISEAHDKYIVPGFVHQVPKPTTKHDIYSELPVSYWTDLRNKVHSVTNIKTFDSPFRRNASFSKPIHESYEYAKPGELENYPYLSQKSPNSAAIL